MPSAGGARAVGDAFGDFIGTRAERRRAGRQDAARTSSSRRARRVLPSRRHPRHALRHTFQVGDRAGQRNLSEDGRAQSRLLGQRLQALNVPVAWPVLAGPVARARDTAELAFGVARVRVVDGLLADDYAGGKLDWVLGEHRRLFAEPVPARANRVLVGHRTPAIMVLGPAVAGAAFPEGAALVLEPSADGSSPLLLGSFALAPIAGGGFHQC
ncbi:MAG: histidine phosphatase family protein [Proteobacteria bacterium]|nr:histidine phosphatase family protein [Burkholderiales bacterium]